MLIWVKVLEYKDKSLIMSLKKKDVYIQYILSKVMVTDLRFNLQTCKTKVTKISLLECAYKHLLFYCTEQAPAIFALELSAV